MAEKQWPFRKKYYYLRDPSTLISSLRTWTYEGRGHHSDSSKSLKSIILISRKYDLDPKLLIDAFYEAWRKNTYNYGSLKIYCRKVKQDSAIFLLTKEDKVISQFPIELEVLKNPDSFKNSLKNIPIPNHLRIEPFQKQKKIDELRFGMKKINVDAKIIEIPPRRLVTSGFGNQFYVSNAKIADETGAIRLSLWNGQIDKVHIGDKVEIENCCVSSFAGERQLRVGRGGTISVIEQNSQSTVPATTKT